MLVLWRPHFFNKITFLSFPNYILLNCLRIFFKYIYTYIYIYIYLVNIVMSDVNPTSLSCSFCDTLVVDKSALHCDKCDQWVHYSFSNPPPYAIIQLKKSSRVFLCHTCIHERFKNDFPELHTEIEGIIKEKYILLLAFIMPNSLHATYNYYAHIHYSYITPS